MSGDIAQKLVILRQVSQKPPPMHYSYASSGCQRSPAVQVKKTHFENNTQVEIRKLNADERAMATAQIIASGKVTESALSHAKALLTEITDHY